MAPRKRRSPLRTHTPWGARFRLWWLVCVMLWGVAGAAPAPPLAPQTLRQQIDAFIAQPQFQRADWGIAVRSLDTGQTLYAHNAERLFVPASTAKLFTTALALAELGSDTRIATTLYATSLRVNAQHTLHGDLILYGRGDPSLGLADTSPGWATQIAAALAARGVQRVTGDLIADTTYFSGMPAGTGWEANDLQTWYGAVPSALNVEGNLIHVRVARSNHICCDITVTPAAAGVHVENLTADTHDQPLSLYRPPGSTTLYASGWLPAGVRRHTYVLSMPDPARSAAYLLREAMARQGIVLGGQITVRHWPQTGLALVDPDRLIVATVDSPSIATLVDYTLKHSDNLFAQALLLQVGVAAAQRGDCNQTHRPTTSVGWALCALQGLLAQAGVPADAVRLVEGSGLARRNLVTPDALVTWLAWITRQPWGSNLRNALPVAGIDGTLRNRLRKGDASGNLQAKTGTMNHVYTLAGFVTDAAGEHLAFAIALNRYPRWGLQRQYPHAPSPKHALDAIARMLAQHAND